MSCSMLSMKMSINCYVIGNTFLNQSKDHTLLLDLLEKVDVYPLTNAKVLALVLQFVERYSDEESNPYLKKLHFWKSIHYYPSVVEEYALDKRENF